MSLNAPYLKSLLGQFFVQKFLTKRLLHSTDEQGIASLFLSLSHFTIKEAVEKLQQEFGYKLEDRVRLRMVKILVDLLCECGFLEKKEGFYLWNEGNKLETGLSQDEIGIACDIFKGQVNFFEECIAYADAFLRGNPPLYSFDSNTVYVWEEFLGNAEFSFARSVLVNLLLSERSKNVHVLDLCYGPGFDILQMQEQFPDIEVTAVDFKDIFHRQALHRIPNPKPVNWIKSELWRGFGTPLPFSDSKFDIVFFACADPYIPNELREYVYRDIFRVLKGGGALGILNRSYPDPLREYVKDTWVRRGILCHDFAESVCEGWYGFYDAQESINLFKTIGYTLHMVMLNASIWKLDKP